jgi:hypothetical protein
MQPGERFSKKYCFDLPFGFKFSGIAYKWDILGITSHCILLASTFWTHFQRLRGVQKDILGTFCFACRLRATIPSRSRFGSIFMSARLPSCCLPCVSRLTWVSGDPRLSRVSMQSQL